MQDSQVQPSTFSTSPGGSDCLDEEALATLCTDGEGIHPASCTMGAEDC
jgi:hypothetical protein